MQRIIALIIACILFPPVLSAQETLPARTDVPTTPIPAAADEILGGYLLGPGDEITIWVLGLEEFSGKPFRVDPTGMVDLPLLGSFQARGHTAEQLKLDLVEKLKNELKEPRVSVSISEFRSQPVSVLGAVKNPGVHQLQGHKTLVEILSLAGGLQPDAGYRIDITRRLGYGRIPLAMAKDSADGQFSVAEVMLKAILEAHSPQDNILICPNDVITVPRADKVYVFGEVRKPGVIVLMERQNITVIQSLSMAEGLGPAPATGSAKIMRNVPGNSERQAIPLDLKKIMAGKALDMSLQAEDILFVPTSGAKKVSAKAFDAALQTISGVIIWGGHVY